jgi:MoaA/NifB/PqqE/SkfB family radical SAM enzyme
LKDGFLMNENAIADSLAYLRPTDYVEKVGFCYTFFCNCQCEHCCSSCGPWRTEKIDPAMVVDVLRQAQPLGTRISGFTGGEALTFSEELLLIMHQVKNLELKFTLATNCSFGRDMRAARSLLSEMKDLGLISLFLSYDVYHAAYVPPDYVATVLELGCQLGIPTRLYSHQRECDPPLEALLADEVRNGIQIVKGKIIPTGRAALLPLGKEDFNPIFYEGFCDPQSSMMVFPDGRVFPCCAIGNTSSRLELGSVATESFSGIVDRYRRDPFYRFVKTRGFKGLYEIASTVDSSLVERPFVEVCSFCKYLIENQSIMHAIKAALDDNDIRIANELLDQVGGEIEPLPREPPADD